MEFGLAEMFGALIRWLARGCRTRFRDELDCVDGWFENIPILGTFENDILAQAFVLLVIAILAMII